MNYGNNHPLKESGNDIDYRKEYGGVSVNQALADGHQSLLTTRPEFASFMGDQ
jgi:ABC-type taurine transport system substrate-binding protein